jgi:MoaA/NifB/PqqE/SkfB family radical SAM enzyme
MNDIHQLYHSFRALYRARVLKKKTPLIISWSITDQSAAGKPCYDFLAREDKELSSDEAIDVVDQLAKAGVKRVILTGGDPLMRFDFGSIIDQLREKNISVFVETYGSLVERKIEFLRQADQVCLPLDGPEPVQDALRYAGSYQEVMQAAKALQDNGVYFMFKTMLTSKNIDVLDVPLEIARHFNTGVYFQPIPPILPGAKTAHPLMFSSDRMKHAMIRLIRHRETQYRNILNTLEALRHFYHWPESTTMHCDSAWISAHIDIDGAVMPCPYVRQIPANQVLRDGFAKAFDSLKPTTCQDCWHSLRYELHAQSLFSVKNIASLLRTPNPKS